MACNFEIESPVISAANLPRRLALDSSPYQATVICLTISKADEKQRMVINNVPPVWSHSRPLNLSRANRNCFGSKEKTDIVFESYRTILDLISPARISRGGDQCR